MKILPYLCALILIPSLCLSAELIIKVGNSINPDGFKDGDVIHAMNDKRISLVHLGHICHVKNTGLNKDGRRLLDSLLDIYLSKTCRYKFERINTATVRRTNLDTLEQDIISNIPNASGEYIDVSLYINRRLDHVRHKIFGIKGSEYWYGGNSVTIAKLDDIWNEVELQTSNERSNFTEFPFTENELKQYLAIGTNDMTDIQVDEYTKTVTDIDGNIIELRKYRVNYENDLGLTIAEINKVKSKNMKFDNRKMKSFLHASVVRLKP